MTDRTTAPHSRLPRIVAAIAILIVLGYLGAAAYLRAEEKTFIYQAGERRVWPPARQFALNERVVTYPSTDGVPLQAGIVPAAPATSSNVWLLICHGNYGNV